VPREFRGVWVATVDNIDWPSKKGLTTAQAQRELLSIVEKAHAIKLNAIVFQVRPHADAMYESNLEPWSEYLTGTQGQPPEPRWDPLEFLVKEAHQRGIEVHAWFNPYRAWHKAAKSLPSRNYIGRTRPNLVKQYGEFQWMDPAEGEVQAHSKRVILDVVKRYDIDGVHIDDYFYPYKSYAKGADFPDEPSWKRYLASGGKMSRSDWRRSNVDQFVRDLYQAIHKEKSWVKFGISPFGIYRPGQPADVKAGMDQYEQLYADPKKWLQEGWCDYMAPQLYWRIKGDQPYPSLLKWWIDANSSGRHIWPGLATGNVNQGWPTAEIAEQVRLARATGGVIHYSMKSIMQGWKGIDKTLQSTYPYPALPPACPWLDSTPPKQPRVRAGRDGSVVFDIANRRDVRWWAVYRCDQQGWNLIEVLPGSAEGADLRSGEYAVAAVDRAGNESPPYRWTAL
jgi:uncharacterized lipoprotein YddW (UPF0748 family)